MRLFVSGSAPLLAETHREWSARTGHAILERYGMTETNMNTSNPYDGDRMAGAVGFPLPGVSVRITDPETGKDLAPRDRHDRGQGPERLQGLLADAGEDRGRVPRRRLLHHRRSRQDRRAATCTSSAAARIWSSPAASTSIRRRSRARSTRCPAWSKSAVIGVPHPDFGEGVIAVVVGNKGAASTKPAVLEALDGRLAKFKLPKRVFFVDELPRNTMGKVQKNILRDTYAKIYAK